MSTIGLLNKLKRLNVTVQVQGGSLKISAPEGRLDAGLVAELNAEKEAIINFLSTVKEDYLSIPKVEEQADYDLSYAQKRIWIFEQMQPGTAVYTIGLSYWLRHETDRSVLERIFTALVERHESLRTVFIVKNGEPRQKILSVSECGFKVQHEDLHALADPIQAAREMANKEIAAPFNLEKGPLLRVRFLQTAAFDYCLLFTLHHIIADGLSVTNLMSELFELYTAFSSDRPSSLAQLPIQYKDYVYWQQKQLSGENFRRHKAFWLDRFSRDLPVLNLPTVKPRPAIQTYNGERAGRFLTPAQSQQLLDVCQQEQVTLFMLMLTALNALLYCYTNQTDLIIGTPVAGREHNDLETQVGTFMNTLALRTRFTVDQSLMDLLKQIKEDTLRAYDHQVYPFDLLLEELNQVRDSSRSPLFDVMLVKSNEKEEVTGGEKSEHATIHMKTMISKFDLTFSFVEAEQGIYLSVEYNTDLFDKLFVERMMGHYAQMLTSIISQPATPLRKLDYIGDSEREELLYVFNTAALDFQDDCTLVHLFERSVEKYPDRTALVCEDRELTYRELNSRVNQLARALHEQYDVRPEQPVGLLTRQSENMIVALLGILKAGGAYVPIEQDYPTIRKQYIIQDAGMKVLITHSDHLLDLDFYKGDIMLLDALPEGFLPLPAAAVSTPRSHHLAYIVYTSGSTGEPKGVMISHGAVVDYFYGLRTETNIEACKSFGLFSTIAADLGNTVIYASLFTGGKLHVLTKEEVIDPQKVLNLNLDCIKIVPSHWKALQTGNKLFSASKCLVFGGERLTADILFLLRTNNAKCHVYNHYGPSETTIGKLIKKIDLDDELATISIGAPFGKNSVYIMSDELRIQAIGIPGEICISGAGLSRGYLNQPQLTAEKFVANPFLIGQRMYKTGDLGRWLLDGSIEFIGRQDDQVKIRGYRIELKEIESKLQTHHSVESAVVIIRETQSGEKELVAYIVAGSRLESSALRTYLSALLPSYMLPSFYVQLDHLSLTPNGKIDKRRLPAPELKQEKINQLAFSPLQRRLIQIWEAVLKMEGVGLDDNFFELGGHSLKAIQLMAQINKELALNINPGYILLHATIRSFIDALPEKPGKGLVITLNNLYDHKPNIFFIPPVIGTSLVYLKLIKWIDQEYNCYGLQNKGFDYDDPFDNSVEMAAQSFADEILNIQPLGEIILCGYSSGVCTAYEISKILEEKGLDTKLVLLDRGPAETEEYTATEEAFNVDFDLWIGAPLKEYGFGEQQVGRIRGLWYNNLRITNRYRVSRKIKGDIIAFEGEGYTNRASSKLEAWNKFTSGSFTHFFLDGGHNDILNDQNSEIIASHINIIKQTLNGKR